MANIQGTLLAAVTVERGHFRYESGHHGDLWLGLERLLSDARRLRALASALAEQAIGCAPEVVCGPLTGGAFVAQLVALELDAGFAYAARTADHRSVSYRIPHRLRRDLEGRRILLVDDAANAGSALLATQADVLACGGQPVGCASLIALGDAPARIAAATGVPFYRLATIERSLWLPDLCPLCAAGQPLAADPLARQLR